MKTSTHEYFNGGITKRFDLVMGDFDFLSNDFRIADSSDGFDLTSVIDDKLSIHINSYSIKYDRDVSARKMPIATERVEIKTRILYSIGEHPHDIEHLFPKTTKELAALIDEFMYKPMGSVDAEDVINFLNA